MYMHSIMIIIEYPVSKIAKRQSEGVRFC